MGYGGGTSIRTTKYLFIDGGYFDKVVVKIAKEFFKVEDIPIDYNKVRGSYNKVFYYNALPGKGHGEKKSDYDKRIDDKVEFYNKLKLIPSFHVYEGVTYGSGGRIRQKAVDIKIAIDMFRHTINKNMDNATLLAGDLDFKPLLDALLMEGMYTTLYYYPSNTNNELLFSADYAEKIKIETIYNWAANEFQSNNQIPRHESLNPSHTNSWKRIKEFQLNNKSSNLYKDQNNHYVVEIKVSSSSSSCFFYYDLDLLLKFLREDKGAKIEGI